MTSPGPMVNTKRPLVLLAIAAVLSLGGIALPSLHGNETAAASGDQAATKPPAASKPDCGTIRESLRPVGPLPQPGAMPDGSTMAKIKARGRLIAGVDQGKYLLGYRNPQTGQLEGSDIDIVHTIAAAIFGDPNRVQFVVRDIADRVSLIEQGQVDVVVNSFTVTCARQKSVEFSTPYTTVQQRLLVPASSGINEVEQLAGQKVCTSIGATNEAVLRKLPLRLQVVTLPGIPDCVVALQQGKVAAVSSDDGILAGMAAQDPQTKVVGRALAKTRYSVGMSPKQPDLVRFVNGLIERDRANGSLAASAQKWLGDQLHPVPAVPAAKYRD
jgi:polar amino acid transport system substrate-binding protein